MYVELGAGLTLSTEPVLMQYTLTLMHSFKALWIKVPINLADVLIFN